MFALALAVFMAVDVWLLRWVPIGSDTGDNWHIFYSSYTELFFRNDLSHWLPYAAYGQPNLVFLLMEVSSTDYLMMVIGKLLHVRNAMLLFQLSLVADHVLFLFGMYLLSRLLFTRRSAVLLCVIGSLVALHGLEVQFIHVFRILSWYPLIIYFLARFFRERKPEMLWIAGVVFASWCPGTGYMPPHMILAVAPFVVIASLEHPQAWRSLFSLRARNLVMMAACASVVVLYVFLAHNVMNGIEVTKTGRETAGTVSLASFLDARNHTLSEALISLYSGGIFYIGLLPLGCVAWGVFGARSSAFHAFMASSLLLIWFALSGVLAIALFYAVPFFSSTHYLYLALYLIRAPLLLAGAAAWDVFVPSRKNLKNVLWLPVIAIFLLDLALYGDAFVLAGRNARTLVALLPPVYRRLATYGAFVALALIIRRGYGWARARRKESWPAAASPASFVAVALLAALLVELFQYSYHSGLPTNKFAGTYRDEPVTHWTLTDADSEAYQAGRITRLAWQAERLEVPNEGRQDIALRIPSYYHTYAFAQFDPCEFSIPPLVVAASMGKLLALRDRGDRGLLTILGCRAPKMRLVTNAVYADDEEQAASAVRHAADLAGTVILQLPRSHPRPAEGASSGTENPGTVAVTQFAANELTASVHVGDSQGSWLVYADAYDSRWRAWINGQPTPIVPAYVGLKAVRVPKGDSVVRMEFRGAATLAMTVFAFAGAMCSLSLLGYCAACCIAGFPGSNGRVVRRLPTLILDSARGAPRQRPRTL